QNILRLAICSELRRGILVSLREGKKALSELRTELEISSTTAIHALRELERDNFVFQGADRDYALTKIGEVIALKLSDFIDAIKVLKKHEDFWLTHDLSGIPEPLLERIGMLRNSDIVKDTATDIFKVHSNYIDMLKDAKEIKGVSSIFVPDYPLVFEELLLKKKADIELVVTEEVLGKIDEEILKKIVTDKSSKLKLYVTKENVKAAFTVTDFFIAFGFYRLDGTYDYSNDLRSYDKEAIEWGNDLFEWHRKQAEKVLS
ncbi:MAG: winged helix-turn-helix domain-containing protein, partial [Methanophagales archaeon]|nr:winged helix-turn-helix domain-containing protein [Methanophagales archaeon]